MAPALPCERLVMVLMVHEWICGDVSAIPRLSVTGLALSMDSLQVQNMATSSFGVVVQRPGRL